MSQGDFAEGSNWEMDQNINEMDGDGTVHATPQAMVRYEVKDGPDASQEIVYALIEKENEILGLGDYEKGPINIDYGPQEELLLLK